MELIRQTAVVSAVSDLEFLEVFLGYGAGRWKDAMRIILSDTGGEELQTFFSYIT